MASLHPIPQPRGVPFLGHIFAIDGKTPLNSFTQWARELGEIYSMTFINKTFVVVNSAKLAAECCDESRFHKHTVDTVLEEIRVLGGDGLFTAYHGEENWGVAHRILVPAFGPASILGMFDDMYDILSQLVLKWERFGPQYEINPVEDFTRLAFDTIALCAMSHRLNSFYTDGVPPFVQAMGDFLFEADQRSRRPTLVTRFMTATNEKYEADMKTVLDLARHIVDERRAHPTDKKDLLNAMLDGRDAKTGKKLSDENIMQQMITFLSAGHETSASMLAFLMYEVLKHPGVYAKLRAEVDAIVGIEKIRPEHIGRLPYLNAVMRETLRLRSPINGFSIAPFEDTVIGGKFFVKKGQPMIVSTMVHRDPEVYGDDADEFKPERMLDGRFEDLPAKSWLPFGNGARGCIGRSFAWQEIQMVIATLFQKFDFRLVDPAYKLQLVQTLVVKPDQFRIHAIPRQDTNFAIGLGPTLVASMKAPTAKAQNAASVPSERTGQPLHILYGSNTGSCEMFAERLASEAADHGFRATIGTLDSAVQKLPTDRAVIIITASFEGEPPDNASLFVKYLESLSNMDALAGVRYAVFGCGNRDWVHTYQRIPKLVDAKLSACGATRLLELGDADASGALFMESFDEWEGRLWGKLAEAYRVVASDITHHGLKISAPTANSRASLLRQPDAQLGVMTLTRLLTKPGAVDKHHIEIELPDNMTYRAGDYVSVLPTNSFSLVRKALTRFNLSAETELHISSSTPTTLPTQRAVTAYEIFSGYVELGQPATRKNIESLLQYVKEGSNEHKNLQNLLEQYVSEVLDKRLSVLGLLERYTNIVVPLASFVGMLPAMRARLYSISSSPLWHPGRVSLTFSVLCAPALSDPRELFHGVASTFLAGLQPGDRVQIAVRPGRTAFHLPATPETPIVMFASGSGIAPMRGFLQERAAQKAAGRDVGPVLLFFGCRAPDVDYLYADDELARWVALGVVDVRPAFSRASDKSEGCRYVQDRVWHDRAEVVAAFESGAKFYTCGTLRIALCVKEAWFRILEDLRNNPSNAASTLANAIPEQFWASIQNERYAADIFG